MVEILPSVSIRPAVKEDCPRLMELVHELAAFERAADKVKATLEHFTDSGFGPNPVWWAFVACVEESIEGFALYYIRYSTWNGRLMYLEDILVTEKMRGKGLGPKMFDRLREEAAEKKLRAIVWQVLDWNEPAIGFYKKYDARFESGWVNCGIDIP
jgi:GNAT superfamily N-acetyltransferase